MAGVEGEDALGDGVCRLADGDSHRWCRCLQAGGHVDGVAGEETFATRGLDVEAHQGLAGVDADADLDRLTADAGQGVDLVDQPQGGAHRPLGVVLVQGRYTKDRDHRVADVLLDDPAVGLDDATCRRVVAPQHRIDEFGVVALGDGGEADEIAEECRDGAALLEPARPLLALSRL